MSLKNARILIEKCKKNKSVQNKFKAAGIEGFEDLSKKLGYPCKIDHIKKVAFQAARKTQEKKVSGKKLVMGGYGCVTYC